MVYILRDQLQGHQPIAVNSTTKNHPLGIKVVADDETYGGGEFIYLQGVASTVVGSLVLYNPDDWTTSLAVASDQGSLAVAMSVCVASEYGWYHIKGKASVKALTGFVDNADCYLTATAGSIDDAVVSGDLIYNMKGASAVASGLADVEIDYPRALGGEIFDSTALTSSTAELNILDGVTATAAELNYVAGVTPGVQAATKAVVADANVNTGVAKITALHIGASGSETQVNATAAEINAAADVSARSVTVTDAATYTVLVANSGKTHIVPDLSQDCLITLPTAAAGLEYTFVYGGVAADVSDWNIDAASATNFMLGGLAHLDSDADGAGDEVVVVAPNGSTNAICNVLVPQSGTRVSFLCDGTNWIVSGYVVGATAPTFGDT